MVKVILKGTQQTQWNIGNRYLPGNIEVELTEEEVAQHKDVIVGMVENISIEKPKPIKVKKVK